MPSFPADAADTGLLLSGGLDSSILLWCLIRERRRVQPFYVRAHLAWEEVELDWLVRLLAATDPDLVRPLVILDLPLADVYGRHWSVTGGAVPGADTPDEAVYLPGRNALLVIKAFLWCHLHGISRLALAPLASNPFADATDEFFAEMQAALNRATGGNVEIVRPFSRLHKREVMELGRHDPLAATFSCIAPVGGVHCGRCNKCAERQAAFRLIEAPDPTRYAAAAREA